jgi:hypothetical protein
MTDTTKPGSERSALAKECAEAFEMFEPTLRLLLESDENPEPSTPTDAEIEAAAALDAGSNAYDR